MQKITQNTFQKLDHLLSEGGVDSEKALLTSKGDVYSSRSVAGRFLRFLGIAKPVKLNDFKAFLAQKMRKLDMNPSQEMPDKTYLTGRSFRQMNENIMNHNTDLRRDFFNSFAKLEDGLKQVDEVLTMCHYAEQSKLPETQYREELATILETFDREFEQVLDQADAVIGDASEQLRIPHKILVKLSVAREAVRAKLGPDSPVKAREYHQELLEKGFSLENTGDFNPARLAAEAGRLDNLYKTSAARVVEMETEAKARARERVEEEARARAEEQAKARADQGANAQAGTRAGVRNHRYILSPNVKQALQTLGLDPKKAQQLTMRDIRVAYKKVSLMNHPDKVLGGLDGDTPESERSRIDREATEKYKEISNAHELLLKQGHIFH